MEPAVSRAIDYVRAKAKGAALAAPMTVTLNFHPDTLLDGQLAIERMAKDGYLRSQFETGTSNGGLTAYPGGDRWIWESRIFGRAYDDADPALRPKYGALNHRHDPLGGSRRFGSCYFRLASHMLERTTFCYPDSHLEPADFGTTESIDLISLWEENKLCLDPQLDNYIEAHVHGRISIAQAAEAVVLDPSYRGTFVEDAARALGCAVEWHGGYCLSVRKLGDCEQFRGRAASAALQRIGEDGRVTPLTLGKARDKVLDYQTAKWAWHCIAKFGEVRADCPSSLC